MNIRITIPKNLEARIAKRAIEQGITLEEYVCEVLDRDVSRPTIRELFEPVRQQVRASGANDKEVAAQIQAAVKQVRKRRRA
jgi:hypothetical protein